MVTISTCRFYDLIDITARVREYLHGKKLGCGSAARFVGGVTAAPAAAVEYEPGLVQDLKQFVEKIFPSDRPYHDDQRWFGDGFSRLQITGDSE